MAGLSPGDKPAHRLVKKYLSRYAEPDIGAGKPLWRFDAMDAMFILPIYDEPWEQLSAFLNPPSLSKKVTMVWVFNCPDNASSAALKRTNDTLARLKSSCRFEALNPNISVARISENITLYVIERCQPEKLIPSKQGVGLARKLGMDLALALCDELLDVGMAAPAWLHCCDADVSLPVGYFDIEPPQPAQAISLYPFKHQPEPGYELAMALYDFRLYYYETQLRRAGSPYAFQTVGSIIAVTPLSYAQVRGMPRRSGGEDFYFLNKVAKVGAIRSLSAPPLTIAGRPSSRVPIGTGPAIQALHAQTSPLKDYLYYHPEIFRRLRDLLMCARAGHDVINQTQFAQRLLEFSGKTRACVMLSALERLGIKRFFEHVQGQSHQQSFGHLFDVWFDGFITLKFVHAMRDVDCPSLSIEGLQRHSDLLSDELLASISTLLKH